MHPHPLGIFPEWCSVTKTKEPTVETTERQPIVWIVNEGGHNYEDAVQYGRLFPVTEGSVNPFNVDRMMVNFLHRLRHADAEDYVLISGLPILNAIFVAMWLARFTKIRLLQWSTREEKYEYRLVERDNLVRLAMWDGESAT
jgi:hypothetical protein